MTSPTKAVMRYADKAMFEAAPMANKPGEPDVHLLWMTPDPLGVIAAACRMYEGKPTYKLSEVSDEERRDYWEQLAKTHLTAPLEFVKFHFYIEGVDRAFTHQLVRQRTAVYAQESLRFAVKEKLADEVAYPPSFADPRVIESASDFNDMAKIWDDAILAVEAAYEALIANGVPAEDARGLLPTCVPTRIHYCTDLRNLLDHAGNRLCTQAQYHWRVVFMKIREAIRNYRPDFDWVGTPESGFGSSTRASLYHEWDSLNRWQQELITDTSFVPQCYLQGRCTFKADFDRGCTIRPRVEEFAKRGIPSDQWEDAELFPGTSGPGLHRIQRSEWLDDPQAGFVR